MFEKEYLRNCFVLVRNLEFFTYKLVCSSNVILFIAENIVTEN